MLIVAFVAGVPFRYAALANTCMGDCPSLTLTLAEAMLLESHGASLQYYATLQLGIELSLALVYTALAFFIFWRRSHTWTGIFVSFAFLSLGTVFWTEDIRALVHAYPVLARPDAIITAIAILSFVQLFYIFPDGRFVPRWTVVLFASFGVVVLMDAIAPFSTAQASSASLIAVAGWLVCAAAGFLSQIYRYRRVSTHAQRQQTKWVTFGFVCVFAVALPWAIFVEFAPLLPGPTRLIFNLTVLLQNVVIALFPVTVVVSILRYRLYDIDVIIRKSLQYGVLSVLLILVYFGAILLLQGLFRPVAGESPLLIVLSTLLIAALFNPLRTRIQATIDRRFYRKKYDAQQVLARFAITARDETDMNALTAELAQVVQETMEPEQVRIWLRE